MRRIWLFMNVSLDGYVEAPGHDISWTHSDEPFEAFSPEGGDAVDTLLFGRKTYEMMVAYWPTPQAAEAAPEVAKFMNGKSKVVASHTSFEPGWSNVTVISDDVAGAVRKLKEQPGKDIAIFGSNNLCVSLIQEGLIDEFQILVNPVVLGEGTSLFHGLPMKAGLRLADTRRFESGRMLLTYQPAARYAQEETAI